MGQTYPAGERSRVIVIDDDAGVRLVVRLDLEHEAMFLRSAATGRRPPPGARRAVRDQDGDLANRGAEPTRPDRVVRRDD